MVHISLFAVLNLLHFHNSTFRSMCAVPNMAAFCSYFISCFLGMLLRYFLNDSEMLPVAPIITGITFVFTFHMSSISIVKSLYFSIFSASFLITLLLQILTYKHHPTYDMYAAMFITLRPTKCRTLSSTDPLHIIAAQVDMLFYITLNKKLSHQNFTFLNPLYNFRTKVNTLLSLLPYNFAHPPCFCCCC